MNPYLFGALVVLLLLIGMAATVCVESFVAALAISASTGLAEVALVFWVRNRNEVPHA